MRFSIIVTVYNLGSFLEECLSSIKIASKDYPVEVIVVNDGSDDGETVVALNAVRHIYTDYLFFDKHNGGPASARNFGIMQSSGEYIIPFDADNIMRPDFFEKLSSFMDMSEGIAGVYYYNALFFGNKNVVWPDRDFDLIDLSISNFIDSCACFPRHLFDELNGFDDSQILRGFEDWDFWLRAASLDTRFKFLKDVLFDYRVRTGSMLDLAWPKRNQIIDYIFAKQELTNIKKIRIEKLKQMNLQNNVSFFQRLKWHFNRLFYLVFI